MTHELRREKLALSKKVDPYSEMKEGVEEEVGVIHLSL